MPWRETSVMEQRIQFVAEALGQECSFGRLCERYGVARSTGYRWLWRYREVGSFALLRERSRRPHRSPRQTPAEVESRVVGLRRRYGWGARKLRVLLSREGIELPVVTVHRILRRNGLVAREDVHRPAVRRFERSLPNQLWQMDFKGELVVCGGECFPLSLLDDHSRYALGLCALSSQRGGGVQGCMVSVFERYGVPEAILMDHGTPWWSTTNEQGLTWLAVWLINQDIQLHLSGYRHPQTQGKVERFHQTLKRALRHHGKPDTIPGYQRFFEEFLEEYNYVRPHESLDMEVPANRYRRSQRAYNPTPREWEYPEGSVVKRLNTQGCLEYRRRRYFVCEALAGQRVRIQEVEHKLLVSYRHMYIREIDTTTARSRAMVTAEQNLSTVADVMITTVADVLT